MSKSILYFFLNKNILLISSHIFGETSKLVGEKVQACLKQGLKVILCVGETLQERESEKTENVVSEQLTIVNDILKKSFELQAWNNIVIAYEPVWAIGTGKTATPLQAQEVHAFIRNWLKANVGEEVATICRIIYGGSVKTSNCGALYSEKDIDGFLVGGASLEPSFVEIVKCTAVNK